MLISFDKEIVVGDIRQFIKTEFHGKKRSFLYPKFIPKEQPNIILESVANEFASGDGGLAVDPNLADAIYQEFLLINIPKQEETNKEKVSPKLEYAKAVSRNRIEIKFDTNVRASEECLSGIQFDSRNPHICCQIIFREKPLLKGKI